jgi:hypothetical protein
MKGLGQFMTSEIQKSKSELIDEKLMGLEINDGDKDYGIICRITQTNDYFTVYTNLGYSFNAGLILNLVALANLYEEAAEKAENEVNENVTHLAPAYFENAVISNKVMSRPKPMAHSKQLRSNGSINTKAVIGEETVNITSYVSPRTNFAEENKK